MLDSALARPPNQYHYGETDLCNLAASYSFGIIRNHPFVDGDKRTSLLAAYIFLEINGLHLMADEDSTTQVILKLASGSIEEAEFAQ